MWFVIRHIKTTMVFLFLFQVNFGLILCVVRIEFNECEIYSGGYVTFNTSLDKNLLCWSYYFCLLILPQNYLDSYMNEFYTLWLPLLHVVLFWKWVLKVNSLFDGTKTNSYYKFSSIIKNFFLFFYYSLRKIWIFLLIFC